MNLSMNVLLLVTGWTTHLTRPHQSCSLGVMLNWLKSLVREEAPEVVVDVDLGVETYHRMLKRYPRENVCDVNDELMHEEFFE